jgi:hypothetical protein
MVGGRRPAAAVYSVAGQVQVLPVQHSMPSTWGCAATSVVVTSHSTQLPGCAPLGACTCMGTETRPMLPGWM